MIHLRCDCCGMKFKVPDESAGKRRKCPKCKTPVDVLKLHPPAKPQSDEDGRLTTSERGLIKWGIISGGILVALLILVLFVIPLIKEQRLKANVASLEIDTRAHLRSANDDLLELKFDSAMRRLDSIQHDLADSGLPIERLGYLQDELAQAHRDLNKAQTEYRRKLANGYQLIDGRLMSPQELAAQSARQGAERRQQEEVRRQQEDLVRQESDRKAAAELAAQEQTRQREAEAENAKIAADPVKSFKLLSSKLANFIDGKSWQYGSYGKKQFGRPEITDTNVIKTNSLTRPYIGVCRAAVMVKTSWIGREPSLLTLEVTFAYEDGTWKPEALRYLEGNDWFDAFTGNDRDYDAIWTEMLHEFANQI